MERDIDYDRRMIEIAKNDATVQTEDIAEYYLERCILLEKHNEVLFKFIHDYIEKFEATPLFEDGTHRIIVDSNDLEEAKRALIEAGYSFE